MNRIGKALASFFIVLGNFFTFIGTSITQLGNKLMTSVNFRSEKAKLAAHAKAVQNMPRKKVIREAVLASEKIPYETFESNGDKARRVAPVEFHEMMDDEAGAPQPVEKFKHAMNEKSV